VKHSDPVCCCHVVHSLVIARVSLGIVYYPCASERHAHTIVRMFALICIALAVLVLATPPITPQVIAAFVLALVGLLAAVLRWSPIG
jgi:hypothetical protein